METVRLLVVEEDPIRREGLLAYLSLEPGFSVIGAGFDLVEAMKSVSPPLPSDVAILNMDQMDSMRSWSILRTMLPDTRIVGLTDGGSEFILEGVLVMGINTLLRPDVEPRVLCNAVRSAAESVPHYAPFLVDRIKKVLMQSPKKTIRVGGLVIDIQIGEIRYLVKPVQLTTREKQVLGLLGRGKSNRLIALMLNIKEATVSFHVSNILKKFGVSSRTEAALVGLFLDEGESSSLNFSRKVT